MSSVDYFTTVLSKLAYAKNETQLLCHTLCVPTWLQRSVLGKKTLWHPGYCSVPHFIRLNTALDQTPQIEAKLPINAAPIRIMRRLLENNKKNLSTTW